MEGKIMGMTVAVGEMKHHKKVQMRAWSDSTHADPINRTRSIHNSYDISGSPEIIGSPRAISVEW